MMRCYTVTDHTGQRIGIFSSITALMVYVPCLSGWSKILIKHYIQKALVYSLTLENFVKVHILPFVDLNEFTYNVTDPAPDNTP